MGLVTRDVDGASEVFLKTGDEVPDIEGAKIKTVGPPITNNITLAQDRRPFGIVAPVTLDDGRWGLWLGAFTHAVPELAGGMRRGLIDGRAIIDDEEVTLSEVELLKLSNWGDLLLRARREDGNAG